nr:hypothetical protein BCV43_18120 [Vibrio cyclitrophicus]
MKAISAAAVSVVNSYHKAALSYVKAVCLMGMQSVGTQPTEYELCHQQKELPNDQFRRLCRYLCGVLCLLYEKFS